MTTSGRHTAEITPPAATACAACAHPLADHDALGVRFCTASAASGLSRGCICGK
ncbi:RGCVC family protein [Umezawaea sp. Da 62-37]|uniref:RGCVC family protein n=1 Tax=Umezawaea sp. Da 62-37 TaxID=3075927 RepID=UPI0028F740D2|nr:RGCVC family protein [Umezawaea sp. Da 62-37]WNV89279.1 RGCVC family protein [Umezawaea sp. Da 62-37]